MAKMVEPMTMEQVTNRAALTSRHLATNGRLKAWSDGNNEIRLMFRSGDPCTRDERIFAAATEAEEILTTRKLGVNQQAYWIGRLETALGHLS